MTDADKLRASYRKVISREPPWWVITFHAPSLPAEGVSVRRRTLAEVNEAFWNLYQDEFRGKGVVAPEYEFGPETEAKLVAYAKAHMAKLLARDRYAWAGEDITSALASQHQATLRDIASILHESYWRVSRLHAWRPAAAPGLHMHMQWVRPYRAQRWAARSVYAAGMAARQARIIAADAAREARRRYALRAES